MFFKKFLAAVLLASSMINGCAVGVDMPADSPEFSDYINFGPSEKCEYHIAETHFGNYVDDQEREYNIVVDSPIVDIENFLSADEVAELDYMIVDEHKKMGLPHNDEVYKVLNHGHFVIVDDNDTFTNLYQIDSTGIAGFIDVFDYTRLPCWSWPAGVNWSSIIRANEWSRTTLRVVVHEMIHAVAGATYGGDIDHQHENPLLWDGFEDSLHARVVARFNCEYWPSTCQEN